MKVEEIFQSIKFDANGLVPAIVQDSEKLDVLMMAWMNEESLKRSIKENALVFWSRSRKEFWKKGETSGNIMEIVEWSADCDFDTLLFKVRPHGNQVACHTGKRSCFFNQPN